MGAGGKLEPPMWCPPKGNSVPCRKVALLMLAGVLDGVGRGKIRPHVWKVALLMLAGALDNMGMGPGGMYTTW